MIGVAGKFRPAPKYRTLNGSSAMGRLLESWNNGKEVPSWGVAEIQKMSPSTTGRCSRHAAAVLSNKGVPQFWEM